MDKIDIIENLREYIDLSDKHASLFFENAELVKLDKNEYLYNQGDKNIPLALVKSGCLMTYHTDESENDHVIQFGLEMWWTGDLKAFNNNASSAYSVKAVVPTVAYTFVRQSFEKLLREAAVFERYFRIIFQNSLVSHQNRIIRNHSCTAEEKYTYFKKQYPYLELIAPQKYIASYLGITPEFLSKIRKRLSLTEAG